MIYLHHHIVNFRRFVIKVCSCLFPDVLGISIIVLVVHLVGIRVSVLEYN